MPSLTLRFTLLSWALVSACTWSPPPPVVPSPTAPPEPSAEALREGPLVVVATASPPLCTPSGVCWENPFPSASSVRFDALASTAAGTVAVGSGGNILRIHGDDLDLLEPTGHELRAVVAVSESHAFVAGHRGYLADLDIGEGSLSAKERAFPDSPTGPVFSIAALGAERVFLSSLHGAITEWSPRGYVDRSLRSRAAATWLAQAGSEIVASHGYTVSSLESARAPWTETFATPIVRAIVVDSVRAFALGEHGALYERSAAGWSTALEWPTMLPGAASFQDVAIVQRARRTPLVVVSMGSGNVFVREGFREDGGTFEEQPRISTLFSTTNAEGDELFMGTTSLGVYRFANGRLSVLKSVEFEGPRDDRRLIDDQIVSFSSGPSGFHAATTRGEVLRRTGARRFSSVPKEPVSEGDEVRALLDANGTLYAIGRVVWRLEDGRFTVVRTGAIQLDSGIALPTGDVLLGGYAGTLIRIPARTPAR